VYQHLAENGEILAALNTLFTTHIIKSLTSPLAQPALRNGPLLLGFHSPYKHTGV